MKHKLPEKIFVTGIGTGVGKTLAAAVLCEALSADYWKPIQTGTTEVYDREVVMHLVTNSKSKFHPESVALKHPSSPHYAAAIENTQIELEQIRQPATANRLIIEGAGGVLVPISNEYVMVDMVDYFNWPVVVVVRNYLGSINHTLLTLEFLEMKGIQVLGLIFNGNEYNNNFDTVEHFSSMPVLGMFSETEAVSKEYVLQQAENLRQTMSQFYEW